MGYEEFYVSGSYSAPELGVFAGWVVLKGSFGDCQPIVSDRADIALLFAGECFTDPDARAQLKARGHRVENNTAAWLTHLYEERGDHFFENLNGQFSGLLIDRRQRKAFLFNDRYGMERVYYHESKDAFFFATEAKALLSVVPELRAFDERGLAQFFQYGCTLDGDTLFRDVKLLPAASLWAFTPDACDKGRYFAPATWEAQSELPAESFVTELQETLARIVPRYFDADGEIGISLTGGLDTRMIMASRPPGLRGLVSYTFAGAEGATLDARIAARVASVCDVPHHLLRIGQEFFSEFASLADRTVYATDGCLGICSAHEIYLNRQARALAPIRLTGNFGSEILRGMTTFKPIGLAADLFSPELVQSWSGKVPPLGKDAMHPVSFAAFKEIPWLLFGLFKAGKSQLSARTPYLDNDLVALAFRTPKELRRSSAPAVRVIRAGRSGLDRIPTDTGLLPASRLFSLMAPLWYRSTFKADYLMNEGMPDWLTPLGSLLTHLDTRHVLVGSHKYLHYPRWFRTELAGYLRERLTDSRIARSNLWNHGFVDKIAESHIGGRKNYLREINAVLTCEAIDRLLFRLP